MKIKTPRCRFAVASRVIAAVLGGYAVCALLALTIALGFRSLPREEAILTGNVPAFLAFAGCVIWAFVASTAARAWIGIGAPVLVLGCLAWLLQP